VNEILVAHLIAGLLVKSLSLYSRTSHAWLFVAALGAILCSLNLHVIYYAIYNLKYQGSRSLTEYLAWILPGMAQNFLFTTAAYSIFAVLVIGTRIVTVQLGKPGTA
jgi:hypothetical protein